MGFSGGGSNVTKPHTHSNAIVQDGGALNFDNVTQAALTAGDLTYSNGTALQVLGIGSATDTLIVNTGATAPEWGTPYGAEIHTFTTEETFTPTIQTGAMQVVIDTTAMTGGGVKTTVDGVIEQTITTATSSIRIYNSSTSITIISQAGGGLALTNSYTYGSSEIPAGDLISCLIGDSGAKMYLASNNLSDNETVYEYDLSTPYDVSTASYSSNSFGDPTSANIRGMGWRANGASWIRDSTAQQRFYQFDCSTAWDISTSSETANFDYSGTQAGGMTCIWGDSGSQVNSLVTGGTIYTYNASSAYDITSLSDASQTFDCSSFDNVGQSIAWNTDGTKLFYLGSQNNNVYTIDCSTPWDVSTGTHSAANDLDVSSQTTTPNGLSVSPQVDPDNIYVGSTASPYQVFQYGPAPFAGSAFASVTA